MSRLYLVSGVFVTWRDCSSYEGEGEGLWERKGGEGPRWCWEIGRLDRVDCSVYFCSGWI